jgi:hypothetical protein
MNMAANLIQRIAGIGRFLRKEFVSMWPVFLFFLIGFLFLLLMIKLVLADLSVEVRALSNAVGGALIAAKASLILDETPLARTLENYRRIVAVAVKTFLYGSVTLLLGYLERFLEALHKVHSFDGAIQDVVQHADHYRLFAWILGISVVFALYFAAFEISQRMGDGALVKFFFEPPGIPEHPEHSSKISAGRQAV